MSNLEFDEFGEKALCGQRTLSLSGNQQIVTLFSTVGQVKSFIGQFTHFQLLIPENKLFLYFDDIIMYCIT